MGGKTLIGGTTYDISNPGKGILNGTAYTLTEGKTLIDGIAYDILFPPPTIKDLFTKLTVLAMDGNNNTDPEMAGSLRVSLSAAPADGIAYWICVVYGAITIYKIVNQVVQTTPVLTCGGGGTGGSGPGMLKSGNWLYYKYSSGYGTQGSGSDTTGGAIWLVTFPYPDSVVDNIFATTGVWSADYDISGFAFGYDQYTSNKHYDLYLVQLSSSFDIWECDGTSWNFVGNRTHTSSPSASSATSQHLGPSVNSDGDSTGGVTAFKYIIELPKIVNITGSGNSSNCYVQITTNSTTTTYISARSNLSVNVGDRIRLYIRNLSTSGFRYIWVDDSGNVAASESNAAHSITVPSGPSVFNIQLSYNSSYGGSIDVNTE